GDRGARDRGRRAARHSRRSRRLLDAAAPQHPVDRRPMTSLLLASRTVRRFRAQTVLAIVGVAVIGALLFDMLLLSRGLLLSFSELLASGGYDVRIVGATGLAARAPIPDSDDLVARIDRLPQVERVASIRI